MNKIFILPFLLLSLFIMGCSPDLDDGVPTYGSLNGAVSDQGGTRLVGVDITLGDQSKETPASGSFSFTSYPTGQWDVQVSKEGFVSKTVTVAINKNEATTLNVVLDQLTPSGYLDGQVFGANTTSIIEAATIEVEGFSTSSLDSGYYEFNTVPVDDNVAVKFSKDGYVPNARQISIAEFVRVNLDGELATLGLASSFEAVDGITVTDSSASLTIPANAIVDSAGVAYSGSVSIVFQYFSPVDNQSVFPGSFFGTRTDDSTTFMTSHGFVYIEMKDNNGDLLQFDSTNPSNLSLPVIAELPAVTSLPIWYFDFDRNTWVEQGGAAIDTTNLVGNISATGMVAMNDPVADMITLTGCVANSANQPINRAIIEAQGLNWSNTDFSTDAEGKFSIQVPANSTFDLYARQGAFDSTTTGVSVATVDYERTSCVELNPPAITMRLVWGENPSDLDTMFTGPDAGTGTILVYYADKTDENSGAFLDVDDTSSFGPEILTAPVLPDGVYRYSVKHFSGSSNISESGAAVELNILGQPLVVLDAPAGASSTGDIWVLWDFVVSAGSVTVREVNQVYPRSEEATVLYPPELQDRTTPVPVTSLDANGSSLSIK